MNYNLMSKHSRERMKERANIKSWRIQEHLTRLAWERGTFISFSKDNALVIYYQDGVFIFSDEGKLITFYNQHKKVTSPYMYKRMKERSSQSVDCE